MLIFFPFASSKSRVKAIISAFCAEVLEPRLPDSTTWSAVVTLLYVCPVAQSCRRRCTRCPQHPPTVLLSALDGSNTQPQSFPSSHVILVLQNSHQEHVELLNCSWLRSLANGSFPCRSQGSQPGSDFRSLAARQSGLSVERLSIH